jgi:nitrite reductase (NO-forming)
MTASRTLPVAQQAREEGACCGACAAQATREQVAAEDRATPPPPVTVKARPPLPTRPISRDTDRRVTMGGILLAAMLLGLALASIALPPADRHGLWLPLHLALAGAAGTAVSAVLPFFAAAISQARPSAPAIRIGAIGLVAGGALVVSGGVVLDASTVATAGGLAYVVGLAAVAVAAFVPLRRALAPRVRVIAGAYGLALAQVAVGATMATALLAGFAPVTEQWALLKPAHGWLNLFGFLSVVVATSLIHLAPTVAGSRIRSRPSAMVAVAALVAGPPLVALGFGLGSDVIARLGALSELVGAAALVVHAIAVRRDRGQWTTDPGWHRMSGWSLTAAPAWFAVGVAIASGRIMSLGAVPSAWSVELIAAPLVLGWLVQVLIGSWTHLVPSIGPGDQPTHARQRVLLGRGSTARLALLNGGVALLVLGLFADALPVLVIGGLAALGSVAWALAMLLAAATATRIRPTELRHSLDKTALVR